jgi:hypothetical protein
MRLYGVRCMAFWILPHEVGDEFMHSGSVDVLPGMFHGLGLKEFEKRKSSMTLGRYFLNTPRAVPLNRLESRVFLKPSRGAELQMVLGGSHHGKMVFQFVASAQQRRGRPD